MRFMLAIMVVFAVGANRGGCKPTYDSCEGKSCGDECRICPPDANDCIETAEVKVCDLEGACVSLTDDPYLCGPTEYDPCSRKSCGDRCTVCPPNSTDCYETAVIKACNPTGKCVPDTGALCLSAPYSPCGGKSCGDRCTVCQPNSTDCHETAIIKACNSFGECKAWPADC